MIKVVDLSESELALAYLAATGYDSFLYFPEHKCWRAERQLSEMRITNVSIIPDGKESNIKSNPFRFDIDEHTLLGFIRNENIGLRWDKDQRYELYFQAFPEIVSCHEELKTAYLRIVVLKEFGEILSPSIVDRINLTKTKTLTGWLI